MTPDPTSEPSRADASSRRDRLAARRRRNVRVTALIVAAVLLCGGAALFAAFAAQDSNPQAQAAAAPGSPDAAVGPQKLPGPTGRDAGAVTVRALDHAHPLRLWIGGDSLAGLFGPALGDMVGATGVAQTTVDYKVSSGLWGDDVRNWYQYATQQLQIVDPEAIVFIIGTNDWPAVNQVDANHDGVPDWEQVYRADVDRMMALFVGPTHRTVYWLGAPTLGSEQMDSAAVAIDKVMREEAVHFAPDLVYVDTYKLFSAPDGHYSRHILDENGNDIDARIGDGVHFTVDGAAYLARAVFKLLDARWHLAAQADRAAPIGWTLAQGSSENVPGYSQTPRSRYRSSGYNSYSSSRSSSQTSPATDTPAPTFGNGGGGTTVGGTSPPAAEQTTPATEPPATDPSPPSTSKP